MSISVNVQIEYTNWKKVRSVRFIRPERIFFGTTGQHPESQWFLVALDIAKNESRTFAISSIHSWKNLPDETD
jgi:hypothetical protein